jgi:hypothetical protein
VFRRIYTALSGAEVASAFAKITAPTAKESTSLAGKKLSFTTSDGDYDYDFISDTKFTTYGVEIEYAAKQLKHVVLFTYKIPDGSTFTVIWDTKTSLVTVFEAWLDAEGEKFNREVKREIYYGYSKELTEKPETLHGLTNRLENKSILWKDSTEEKRLDIFNATFYSSFIKFSDPESGIPIAVPSDYIKIDEEIYIYSKMEAEFSGLLYIELIDLPSLKKVGVKLGFCAKDKLHYELYWGKGELAGQLATFTKFTDYGGTYDMNTAPGYAPPGAPEPPPRKKGDRSIYRFRFENADFTDEEAKNSGKNPHSFPKSGIMLMPTGNSMAQTDFLAGKSFKLVEDEGFEIEYEIIDVDTLKWRTAAHPDWQEETYRAFEASDNLYMFGHTQTGEDYGKTILAAVDFDNGLATLYHAKIGNKYTNREVGYEVKFGVIQIDGLKAQDWIRHSFTTDMVGKAFTWNYSGGEQGITSMHTYSSPYGLSWTIFNANQEGGMMSSGPCKYIKLRDKEAYIMSWVEETAGGGLGTVLLNLRTMHDCGFMFGAMGEDKQIGLSTLGAYGRAAGQLDILKYFEPKSK